MKIGTKVQVLYPEKNNEEFGVLKSERFKEADWFWYWVDFGGVSYTVEDKRLIEVKE